MVLNLDKNLLDLKGTPLSPKLNEILADILATTSVGKPAKMMAWAVNLMNTGEIKVTEDDLKFISDIVENSPHAINLAKAQILEVIDKLKE